MKLTLCALFNVSKYLTGLSQYMCTNMMWNRDIQLSCWPQTSSHSHNHASWWHLCSRDIPTEHYDNTCRNKATAWNEI